MMMKLVCGIDEAGRGPIAGPVAAAAVILPADFPREQLNDSKKLSEKRRLVAAREIKKRACWGIALVDHHIIDEINILQATLLAMKQAFFQMKEKLPVFCAEEFGDDTEAEITAIIDGTFCPDIPVRCTARIKADAEVPEVMAASILAKTERDAVMCRYGKLYPEYGYETHKGYPTKSHRDVCRRIGMSPIQRRTFRF